MSSEPARRTVMLKAAHASASEGCIDVSGDCRCSASPMSPPSQPTPVAPGPNASHISAGTSASRATCSSSSRVPSPSVARRTVSHVTPPPNSHVTRKRAASSAGGSHSSTSPPALPSSW